jgi:hypothetical protein
LDKLEALSLENSGTSSLELFGKHMAQSLVHEWSHAEGKRKYPGYSLGPVTDLGKGLALL